MNLRFGPWGLAHAGPRDRPTLRFPRRWVATALGFFATTLQAELGPLFFARYTTDHGLSHRSVTAIARDAKGFLWFGTYDGLHRFDGYRFKIYTTRTDDPHSISANNITAILPDREGILWIATFSGGINRYDPKTDRFTVYRHDPNDPESLGSNYIQGIFLDREGILWVATHGGLNRMKPGQDGFIRYLSDPEDPTTLVDNRIHEVCEDLAGDLWIATAGGVCRYLRAEDRFVRYRHDPKDPGSLAHDDVATLCADRQGRIWIGTWGGGLDLYDPVRNRFIHHRHDPANPFSLAHDTIRRLYVDPAGRLWVATWGGGLDLYEEAGRFLHIFPHPADPATLDAKYVYAVFLDPSDHLWIGTDYAGLYKADLKAARFHPMGRGPSPPVLSHPIVLSVCEDREGHLWIGTKDGLNRYDPKTQACSWIKHDPKDPSGLSDDVIRTLAIDSTGTLWVGTERGLHRLDKKTSRWIRYLPDPQDPYSLTHHNIFRLFTDSNGDLWIGPYLGGLLRYDRVRDRFIRYRHDPKDPKSLSDDLVWALCEDPDGSLWVGTESGGLNRLDRKTGRFTPYRHDPANPHSLSNDKVLTLLLDSRRALWVGTQNGLNRFDREKEIFVRYGPDQGLTHPSVQGLVEDLGGRLWIASTKGLFRFDPHTERFQSFYKRAGLLDDEFDVNTCARLRSGRLFFGGKEGFILFDPDSIQIDTLPPPVVLTDFQILNQPVPIGPFGGRPAVLNVAIPEAQEATLSWKDRIFSLDFAALSYGAPEHIPYAYRLEGFEKEWTRVRERRFVTYTNLPPGTYVFRVKAANPYGVWNEKGTSLTIRITPPFWKTRTFRLLVFLLLFAGLVGVGIHLVGLLRKGEAELAQEKALMRALMESIPDAVYFKDRESRFVRISRALATRFGLRDPEEAIGKTDFDFFTEEHARQAFEGEQRIIRTGEPLVNIEERETWADRPDSWVSTTKMPLRNSKGEIIGTFGISRDITVQKEAQLRLAEAKRELERMNEELKRSNQELELFAYTASHDLQEPLRMVSAYTTLLYRKLEGHLDGDAKEFVGFVTDAVSRMQTLIHDLLAYSRVSTQAKPFKPVSLDEALDAALHNLKVSLEEKQAVIQREPLPVVRADRLQMERVFQNLVGNALKYCEGRPEISITTEKKDPMWIISVKDNGIGIDPKHHEKIFGIFTRLHRRDEYSGTGIGLAIVKKIVERHGGHIWVESEGEGKGCTFKLSLPMSA